MTLADRIHLSSIPGFEGLARGRRPDMQTAPIRQRNAAESCGSCRSVLPEGCARCVSCGAWTFTAESEEELHSLFLSLDEVEDVPDNRLLMKEFYSPIFGGGLMADQTILIGGEPGGGKSVFSLVMGQGMAKESGRPTLLLHTEEDARQVKARAKRLGIPPSSFVIVNEPLDEALECLDSDEMEFGMGVLDSLPDLIGDNPMEAVRVLKRIKEWSKTHQVPFLILDHVNKGEELAGLMRLRHAVDTTVYLRWDGISDTRTLTVMKNRHGQGKSMKLVMTPETAKRPGLLLAVKQEGSLK